MPICFRGPVFFWKSVVSNSVSVNPCSVSLQIFRVHLMEKCDAQLKGPLLLQTAVRLKRALNIFNGCGDNDAKLKIIQTEYYSTLESLDTGLEWCIVLTKVFLQIRNNSDRCWKAIEHLIFMRNCTWKWRLCGGRIAGVGNRRCGVGWEEVFKKRKTM